ncbi:hypothetical protein ABZT48_15400 [Streptomyces avermitilis]|uniref:hypothetical protein n=1 Tax=Streptomyces avermitilis TaxID=33903 RepID=UPI0033AEE1BA
MGPRRLLTTVMALGGRAFLLGTGVLRLQTHLAGVAGRFRAERCEVSESLLAGAWNIRSAGKRPREALAAAPA